MNGEYKKIILIVLFVIALITIGTMIDKDILLKPEIIGDKILSYGALAPFIYITLYILSTILFIPGTILTVLGGAIFGPLLGTIYTIVAATIGAIIAFVIARYLGGGLVKSLENGKFKQLKIYDEKIEENGLGVVLFLRLVPFFPFNGLNYALGLTKVTLFDYSLGSLIGMIPGTFVYVYLGDSIASLNIWQIIIATLLLLTLSYSAVKLKKYNKYAKK